MQAVVLDLDDQASMFLCLTVDQLRRSAEMAKAGVHVLPAVDLADLAGQLKTQSPITLIQFVLSPDGDSFDAHMAELARDFSLHPIEEDNQ